MVYTTRRAVLSSSDSGMRETFAKYCKETLREIYEASLIQSNTNSNKGKPAIGGPVNADKLVAKTLQFFPNLEISVNDIQSTSQVIIILD